MSTSESATLDEIKRELDEVMSKVSSSVQEPLYSKLNGIIKKLKDKESELYVKEKSVDVRELNWLGRKVLLF